MKAPDIFNPEDYVVDSIDLRGKKFSDGMQKIASHRDRSLWVNVMDGRALCLGVTDDEGRPVETITFYTPDPNYEPPPRPGSNPNPPFPCPGGPVASDGGTDGGTGGGTRMCPYVCASSSDGGRICWKVCE